MLPKIEKKNLEKDVIPYQIFNKELSRRNEQDSNINRLKLLKDFLEDENVLCPHDQNEIIIPRIPTKGSASVRSSFR